MAQQRLNPQDLSISKGYDSEQVTRETTDLVDGGQWQLCNEGRGLEREFKFKTFRATWDFMTAVADECKKVKHHPEWRNVYNRTHIRWTTHNPRGLSTLDTQMARFCDATGEAFGAETPDPNESVEDCCGGKR